MALSTYGKNSLAHRFRFEGRHFQIYGTYYPNGLGASSVAFPTDIDTQLIGTGNVAVHAFDRTDNVLTLNSDAAPYDDIEFSVTVPIGAILDIEGVRVYSGKPDISTWTCIPSQPDTYTSYEMLYHEFDNPIRFSSNGTFTITGFEITIN